MAPVTGAWLSLWAAPAALGFALAFNVRRRALLPIALLAILAHLVRSVLQDAGWGLVQSSFAAAILTGTVAYVLAPATGEASPVFAFAPVIPLVPGSLLFGGLEAFADLVAGRGGDAAAPSLFTAASRDVLTAGAVVIALALGSTAPGLLRPGARRGT